jgi:hypothetical protein
MPTCPVCSCDRVYPLLNTWRCTRCKHIWKEGAEDIGITTFGYPLPDISPVIRKKTEPLQTRLEKKLEEILTRSGGKFCLATRPWQAGDISQELFRRYVKRCVKNRVLAEETDRYGRIWYRRPRTKN